MSSSYSVTIGLIIGSALLVGCGTKTISLQSPDGSEKIEVPVEIADAPEERELGLMNRDALEPGTGMLFVFSEEQILSFWMKNTRIPLEILYFDKEGSFVNVLRMQPCEKEPCPTHPSSALAKYALEVNPGFKEEHGVGVGWRLGVEEIDDIAEPT